MKSVARVDSWMLSSAAAQRSIKLPGEVFRILQAGIGPARPERRDLVRGIAGKNHPAVQEAIHATALELVERDPLELELVMAEHARDPRPHVVRLLLDRGI